MLTAIAGRGAIRNGESVIFRLYKVKPLAGRPLRASITLQEEGRGLRIAMGKTLITKREKLISLLPTVQRAAGTAR
jgi:hypothetical protein